MKLTKTERKLLEQAVRTTRGTIWAQTMHVTSQRRGLSGTRSVLALRALVAKGFAEDYRVEHHVHYRNGWATHCSDCVATITEAGRHALEDSRVELQS